MKKLFLLLAFIQCAADSIPAQTLTFHRSYGGARYDDARGILAVPDGGYVFTGLCKSAADSLGDMYLSKVNAAGALLWTRYYGRPAEDGGNGLLATADGGFLISGHTAFSYGKDCDGYLVKTDAEGREQWRAFLGTALDDVSDQSVEMPDGSFFTTGRTEDPATHTFRVLLAKLDRKGNILFSKALPTGQPDLAYGIAAASDGNLYLSGYSYTPGHSIPDQMLLIKCDTRGEVLWSRRWGGGALDERANAVVAAPDGGCYVAGGGSSGYYAQQMLVSRFDRDGELLAANTIMGDFGPGTLNAAILTNNGLAVTGTLRWICDPYAMPFFALLNEDLSIRKYRSLKLAQDGEYRIRCLTTTPEGDFALGGNVTRDGNSDVFLAKILAEANIESPMQDVKNLDYLLFPNPFNEVTYLKAGQEGTSKTLRIYTSEGKLLREARFEAAEYFLQREDLKAGIYLFSVTDEQGKLIVSDRLAVKD